MAESIELREVPGRPGFYYVIQLTDGKAVAASEILERVEPEGAGSKTGSTVSFVGTMHLLPDARKSYDFESAEERKLLERGATAFEILKELGDIDDPYMPECLFCGCPEGYLSGHYDDCVYVRAKKFIEDNR